jgi:EAL domain-containing protein (putative c-di-GMP-specific phosphodiesterase class I)
MYQGGIPSGFVAGWGFGVAVNHQDNDLQDLGFSQLVEDLLKHWRQSPGWLRLEVTQTSIMADAQNWSSNS